MTTLEALKEKHDKELQAAIKNEAIKEAVMTALNLSDANFSAGFMHVYKADCFVNLEAETLNEAITLCEKMNPLQAVRLKGTFLSFRADKTLSEKDMAENDQIMIPYWYVIDGLRQYGEEKTLHWFVNAADYTVEVRCRVKSDPLTRRDYAIQFNKHGEAIREKNELINKSGQFTRVDKFWSPQDQPGRFVLTC